MIDGMDDDRNDATDVMQTVKTELERASQADDETRLQILESLHGRLEAELERDVEAPSGDGSA